MKDEQFYQKRKANYATLVDPIFSKKNWWRLILITVVAVFVEAFIMYGRQRAVPFSFHYYLRLIEYVAVLVIPFVGFLLWANGRELMKQSRGYVWVGKFEVIGKQRSITGNILILTPGEDHRIGVKRPIYNKVSVGDYVTVRRDALGRVEEVAKVDNFSSQLARVNGKRHLKRTDRSASQD